MNEDQVIEMVKRVRQLKVQVGEVQGQLDRVETMLRLIVHKEGLILPAEPEIDPEVDL